MAIPTRKYLSEQISNDYLEEVIAYLLQDDFPLDSDDSSRIVSISGRLSNLAREISQGTIGTEAAQLERNRIRVALLNLNSELSLSPLEQKRKKQKRFSWILGGGIYLAMGGLLLFLIFSPKKNIRIRGNLLVDQVSFTHIQGSYNLGGKSLKEANLSFFENIQLEADSFSISEKLGGPYPPYRALDTAILLKPFPGSEGVILPLTGKLQLDDLPLKSGAKVSLSRPEGEEAPRMVRLRVSQDSSFTSSLSYYQEALLIPEQVEVKGISRTLEFPFATALKLKGPTESRRAIRFTSYPRNLLLEMVLKDTMDIRGLGLRIDSMMFYRKDENLDNQIPISTVMGGNLDIVEAGQEVLESIPVLERQKINLPSKDPIELEQLHISAQGIELIFNGSVKRIEIGSDNTNYTPTWFTWLWHNYKLPVTGLGILLLGFVFFLPSWIKSRILGTLDNA